VIVGAGIFGLSTALELALRCGPSPISTITVVHPASTAPGQPSPFPSAPSTLASSHDTNKLLRKDYGSDSFHADLFELALSGKVRGPGGPLSVDGQQIASSSSIPNWVDFDRTFGTQHVHLNGVFIGTAEQAPRDGSFFVESLRTARERGDQVVPYTPPEWRGIAHGFSNGSGGWASSGAVCTAILGRLEGWAKADGGRTPSGKTIRVLQGQVTRVVRSEGRVRGVALTSGQVLRADRVLVAAGPGTPSLLPEVRSKLWVSVQFATHLAVPEAVAPHFRPDFFPGFAVDVDATGRYGFPVHPDAGTLKVGHHGVGYVLPPHVDPTPDLMERLRVEAWPTYESSLRTFLGTHLPSLRDADIVAFRSCMYTETADSAFLIDAVPTAAGLFVASGGSGHGFKFGPVLGPMIADMVEDRPSPVRAARYGWTRSVPVDPDAARVKTTEERQRTDKVVQRVLREMGTDRPLPARL
jgi:glycine/D-amino acid oxidase-like deaminating enzyme